MNVNHSIGWYQSTYDCLLYFEDPVYVSWNNESRLVRHTRNRIKVTKEDLSLGYPTTSSRVYLLIVRHLNTGFDSIVFRKYYSERLETGSPFTKVIKWLVILWTGNEVSLFVKDRRFRGVLELFRPFLSVVETSDLHVFTFSRYLLIEVFIT